ncbi:YjcZ family sporulation protein [Halalkalibacter wakoensis]|nr:YjcZ family sporulation protein [Halalkalibacter wakoensis]
MSFYGAPMHGYQAAPMYGYHGTGGSGFALIVVLFILLIIVGAAYVK